MILEAAKTLCRGNANIISYIGNDKWSPFSISIDHRRIDLAIELLKVEKEDDGRECKESFTSEQ